jgi:hypothetical protein
MEMDGTFGSKITEFVLVLNMFSAHGPDAWVPHNGVELHDLMIGGDSQTWHPVASASPKLCSKVLVLLLGNQLPLECRIFGLTTVFGFLLESERAASPFVFVVPEAL